MLICDGQCFECKYPDCIGEPADGAAVKAREKRRERYLKNREQILEYQRLRRKAKKAEKENKANG